MEMAVHLDDELKLWDHPYAIFACIVTSRIKVFLFSFIDPCLTYRREIQRTFLSTFNN